MSFLGKEYVFQKQENIEEFANSLGLSDELSKAYINHHPNQKLVQNDDGTYTLSTSKQITFKSGVPFEEQVTGRTCQTTCTLDGNSLTQVQVFSDVEFKTVRDFSSDELVLTITFSGYNGVARRYYKA